MQTRNPKPESRNPHRGFTLIEMLVAIGIIITLLAITLAFLPKRETRLAADGASRLQTYIASAKSRAMRDRAPRGVRLIADASGNFREVQFIESPEIYAPQGTVIVPQWNPPPMGQPAGENNPWTIYISTDVTGAVQYGDLLEFPGDIVPGFSPHRIIKGPYVGTQPIAGSFYWSIDLATRPGVAKGNNFVTTQSDVPFRFIRQPRPLLGEPALQLPKGVYIQSQQPSVPLPAFPTPGWDGWSFPNANQNSFNLPSSFDGNNLDIIFSASGEVINATGGRIVLVVADDNNVSAPTLLTIYTRTGGIASHPVNTDPNQSHYSYTQDGKSSGQ